MRASFAVLTAVSLASQALGAIFVTSPVATTTCSGGGRCTIAWQDNGAAPSLADIGNCSVGIYTGNSQQQTLLQMVTPGVNVATTAQIEFTVDASIGPNDDVYFVRFQSLALRDPAAPTFPYLAFSALFSLNQMTGVFNQTVQSQIDGVTTAPIGGTASASSASATASASASGLTTSRASSSPSQTQAGSSSASRASASASASANAGVKNVAAGAGLGFLAALMGLAL